MSIAIMPIAESTLTMRFGGGKEIETTYNMKVIKMLLIFAALFCVFVLKQNVFYLETNLLN